jgi:hypothetical protein
MDWIPAPAGSCSGVAPRLPVFRRAVFIKASTLARLPRAEQEHEIQLGSSSESEGYSNYQTYRLYITVASGAFETGGRIIVKSTWAVGQGEALEAGRQHSGRRQHPHGQSGSSASTCSADKMTVDSVIITLPRWHVLPVRN